MIHRSDVSMLDEARDAQWSAQRFFGAGTLLASAPAKVNLVLAVGQRGADGYHEVTSVYHALALNDRLYAHRAPCDDPGSVVVHDAPCDPGLVGRRDDPGSCVARDDPGSLVHTPHDPGSCDADSAQCDPGSVGRWDDPGSVVAHDAPCDPGSGGVPLAGPVGNLALQLEIVDRVNPVALASTGPDNLIWRAFDELARALDYREPEVIHLRLEKNIPLEAGLGGGSSDGAAALALACRFWGVDTTDPRVYAAAEALGADVAFFLRGGCGLYTGHGGAYQHSLKPATTTLVLVKPPVGVSTAAAYAAFDEDPVPVPPELLAQWNDAQSADDIPLYNNLEPAAQTLSPEVAEVRSWLATRPGVVRAGRPGVAKTLVCGSGSAVFALMESLDAATAVASAAGARGWWSRVTTLAPWGVTVKDA